jgi:WD40 repeat protein/DNA-binding SARP family transcriptional activator
MAELSIRLLGAFQVALAGKPVTGFATDKARALLAYLVVEADRPHRREVLAGLLWPGYPERSARTSLRSALANLRQVIGDRDADPPFLDISRQTVQFNHEADVWSDVAAFAEHLEVGLSPDQLAREEAIDRLEEAVELHREPFLEGFSVADSPPFEEWALLTREGLERQMSTALQRLADHFEGCGDYKRALGYARRQVELDPWLEAAQRRLMRLLALSGQQNAALAQYESYRRLLATELGVEPSEEIQVAYELLLKGELPPGPPVEREPRVVGECPYRGLAAFREEDAPFFFGREGFAEQLFQALHERPLVAVIVGSSGSGKSSAVFAGLLPRLRDAGDWLIAGFRPGGQPFHALAAALIALLEPELGEIDRLIETHKLAEALNDREVGLYAVVERAAEKAVGSTGARSRRALLLVDQFEELYTLCPDPDTRRHFLETLLAAVTDGSTRREAPLVLLLTLRADFMGQALAHRPFADALQEGSLMLGPMTREELRAAIEKPAEKQGAALEAGLVERLLDDVGEEPGNLPLLEFALTLLWERLDHGCMTHAAYEEIGRVDGALARYAEEVFDELREDEQEAARRIFVQLVQPGEGTEDTRRRATRTELDEEDWLLVQYLADRRLVVTGRDPSTGTQTVEVVHEALLQRWGQLRAWMEADRAFRLWQERLRVALLGWEASEEDEGALLRGAPLSEAEAWWAERGDELSLAERAFIQAGVTLRERRQFERERRRRRIVLALAGGLVLALVLALLAGGQWQRAEVEVDARAAAEAVALEQREEALRQASVGLAAKALAELEGTAPERGVLLALEALEGYPYTPQAESALAQAVEAHTPRLILRWGPYTWAVAWSPDGGKIAAAAETGVIIWDADTGDQWRRIHFPQHKCNGYDLAWSPSGDRFVVVGERLAESVHEACIAPRVWDASTEEQILTFTGHEGQANSVDWSPDGAYILSTGVDGSARIWAADSGDERLTLSGHTGSVNDARWSPGGDQIVTAAADGTAKVWDVSALRQAQDDAALVQSETEGLNTGAEDGTELVTLSGHVGGVNCAAWSLEGDRIATAGADGLIRVWLVPKGSRSSGDTATGEILFTLSGHSDEVRGVAWSPDGERLATSSADGTAHLWDAATGEELLVLRGLSTDLRNVAWSPAGDRLVAGGGTILPVWDVSGRPLRLSGHTADVWDAQWSPDGGRIGTTSYDGTARIWDPVTGEGLLALEHPAGARFFAWSPDGTRIVTTSQDGFARVWDTDNGELLLEVPAPEGDFFFAASWSPDGSRFSVGRASDAVVTIFDAATGDALTSFESGDWAHRLPWSPEGDRIVTGGSAAARVWDTSTGKPLLEVAADDRVYNAEWSPDGRRLVLAERYGKARVTDATSGEELLVFTPHSDDIWHAMWSPDGTRIVSGDESGEVKVWDAATGAEVLSFRAPAAVYSVNWSPDGDYVIAGGYFNPPVVRRAWQSTEELIAHAKECCVSRELTDAEREKFGLPQR